jgi:hypothetical protein
MPSHLTFVPFSAVCAIYMISESSTDRIIPTATIHYIELRTLGHNKHTAYARMQLGVDNHQY